MHRATQRPYVTAGIAVLGAGLIALPAAAAMLVDASALPSVKVADVLLTSTDQDAAADAVGALANVTPDALTTPDLNIAISFDGVTLLHEGTATAFSDPGTLRSRSALKATRRRPAASWSRLSRSELMTPRRRRTLTEEI